MRAAVYHGTRDVRIEDWPDPPEPGPGELTLAVIRAAICGTDSSEYLHGPKMIPLTRRHPASGHEGPMVIGHEFVGRVAAIGAGVEGFEVGQRVVPGAGVSCGRCEWCRAGRTNLCAHYYTLGLQVDGGLAAYATSPASICSPVPDSCGDDAAAIAQPLAVALHAVRRGGAQPGQSLAVIGVGGIGALAVGGASARGLGPLIAVDVDEHRLATARELGAAHLIDAREEDAASRIAELTDGEGAHVVMDCSGAPSSPGTALKAVRRGGQVVIVGLQAEPVPVDLYDLALREVTMTSSLAHVFAEDLPEAIEILATTDLAGKVIDRVIGLDELVHDGLMALAERRAEGKVVVDVAR